MDWLWFGSFCRAVRHVDVHFDDSGIFRKWDCMSTRTDTAKEASASAGQTVPESLPCTSDGRFMAEIAVMGATHRGIETSSMGK